MQKISFLFTRFIPCVLLILLTACSSSPSKEKVAPINFTPYQRSVCQIFEPKDTKYSFTAKILSVKKIYKNRLNYNEGFATTRLIANVVRVGSGDDISPNQALFIDLAPQIATCNAGQTCDFVSPHRYTGAGSLETLLILDALIIVRH